MNATKMNNPQTNETSDEARPHSALAGQAEILDKLRKRLGLDTDKELAELFGVKPSFLSELRKGKRALPTTIKLKILDKLGYLAARDALLALTPQGFAERVRTADNARFSLDLSGLDDELPPPPPEFSQLVAAAIASHGPDAVATVVKAELLAYKARAAAKK